MENYELMKVTIGKFSTPKTTMCKVSEAIEQENVVDIQNKVCIVEDDYVVDVEDFDKKYQIIKTNKYGIILPNQKVDMDMYYALNVKKIEKKDISLLQSININHSYTKYKKKNKNY